MLVLLRRLLRGLLGDTVHLHGAILRLAVLCFGSRLATLHALLHAGAHFFFAPFFFLVLPATESAMAMACFCGRPAFISLRMFAEIVFCDLPFFRGIVRLR